MTPREAQDLDDGPDRCAATFDSFDGLEQCGLVAGHEGSHEGDSYGWADEPSPGGDADVNGRQVEAVGLLRRVRGEP